MDQGSRLHQRVAAQARLKIGVPHMAYSWIPWLTWESPGHHTPVTLAARRSPSDSLARAQACLSAGPIMLVEKEVPR